MTGFIISAALALATITALIFTIRNRKKMEHSLFLFLITFEIIVILAAGWAFMIYGAIIEMGNI